jgi:hypothetical protein
LSSGCSRVIDSKIFVAFERALGVAERKQRVARLAQRHGLAPAQVGARLACGEQLVLQRKCAVEDVFH